MAQRAAPSGMHYRPRQGETLRLLTDAEHKAALMAARDDLLARRAAADRAYRAAIGVPAGPIPRQLGSCAGHGCIKRPQGVPRVDPLARAIQ